MLYEMVFVICTLNPLNPWVGDVDTGPTCVEIERVGFPTQAQCLTRVADTLKVMGTEAEQKRLPLPGPFTFFADCRNKVAQGQLVCADCGEKGKDLELAQAPIYCTFCKE